eukprot:SAG25_NODE_9421_length_373_cov_0.708029_1_plen_38_part_01
MLWQDARACVCVGRGTMRGARRREAAEEPAPLASPASI